MIFKTAAMEDYEIALSFIRKLWTYNEYDHEEVKRVYERVLNSSETFAFFLIDDGQYIGFCHGDYIDTFWMSGLTMYISSLITEEKYRGMGYGQKMVDHAKELAEEKGCKAMILDSGFPRKQAHRFYEKYGFEKSCYGFEYQLK